MPQRSHSHRVQQTLNKPREQIIVHAAGRAVRVCCLSLTLGCPTDNGTVKTRAPGQPENPHGVKISYRDVREGRRRSAPR